MSDDTKAYRDRLLKTLKEVKDEFRESDRDMSDEKKKAIGYLEGHLVEAGVITSEEFVHHHENIGALDHEQWFQSHLDDDRIDSDEHLTDGQKERVREVIDDPDL